MSKIIAVDFDGCLAKHAWPKIGEPNQEVIDKLKREQNEGAQIILWTCRRGKQLENALKWCDKQKIKFDAVNQNLPESMRVFGGDTRKVFAHEYWDDRAVRIPE